MWNTKEKIKKTYIKVWKKLEEPTPLMDDCGKLCDKKCCTGSENDGMLLFPGEELLFERLDENWYHIKDSNITLSDGYKVKLLVCEGECSRMNRPLSCRIFPLMPYLNDSGRVEFRLDLGGFGVCPIVYESMENPVEEDFIESLYDAFPPLLKMERVIEFIEILSQQYDDTAGFLAKFRLDSGQTE